MPTTGLRLPAPRRGLEAVPTAGQPPPPGTRLSPADKSTRVSFLCSLQKYYGRKSPIGRDVCRLRKTYYNARHEASAQIDEIVGETASEADGSEASVSEKENVHEKDDDVIRCVCGLHKDEGLMIQCDKCMVSLGGHRPGPRPSLFPDDLSPVFFLFPVILPAFPPLPPLHPPARFLGRPDPGIVWEGAAQSSTALCGPDAGTARLRTCHLTRWEGGHE